MNMKNFTLFHTHALARAAALACLLHAGAACTQEVSTDFEYDATGNPTKVTDGLKRATQMTYDPLKRLKQIQQPAPSAGAARPTTSFTYDALDQLQSVTDPRNLVTRYTVDGLGKRTVLSSPDSGQTTATFNSLGYISTSTSALGIITKYDYDLINRLTSITYGSTPYRLNYDEGEFGAEHLTSMTYPAGRTDFVWDQIGRLVAKKQTTNLGATSQTFAMQYAYGKSGYSNGHLISMTYPSGNRIEYGYALPGLITSITLIPVNGGTPVSLLRDIKYRPFGPAQSWTWGNSTDTQKNTYAKSFDLSSRITSLPLGNAFNQGVLRTIAYDDGNRIRKIIDTGMLNPAQVTQTFDYDDLDHLTAYGDGSNNYTWQYDANGNRTQSGLNGNTYPYVIDPLSNRFKGITINGSISGGGNDKAGNQKTTFNSPGFFLYGPTGRIESVYNNELLSSANYTYNSLGERLNTGNSHYFHDESGRLAGEYDLAGQPMEETVFLGNQPVAVLKPGVNQETSVYYVYADHLNTPRLITRAQDDKVVWRWNVAEPFGASLPNDNPNGLGQFVYNRRFPGQVFDAFLGVIYNYYRDLDPATGRYLQSDPIGLKGGVNTYAYVGANPLSFVDVLGLAKGDWKNRPMDPNSEGCKNLGTKIENLKIAVNRAVEHLATNPQNLPYYAAGFSGPGGALSASVWGHEQLLAKYRQDLQNNVDQFFDRCSGPPAPPTAPVTDNCPAQNRPTVPPWLKVLGVGAVTVGIGVCAAMEPCGAILGGSVLIGGAGAAAAQ